jgi:hypothetical protein
MTTASTERGPTRIRELLLINLFEVFSERDQAHRLEMITSNYEEDVV